MLQEAKQWLATCLGHPSWRWAGTDSTPVLWILKAWLHAGAKMRAHGRLLTRLACLDMAASAAMAAAARPMRTATFRLAGAFAC